MDDKELQAWLRANSSGIYRPAALAAERLAAQAATIEQLTNKLAASGNIANGLRVEFNSLHTKLNYLHAQLAIKNTTIKKLCEAVTAWEAAEDRKDKARACLHMLRLASDTPTGAR